MSRGEWIWASHPWVVSLLVLGTVLLWAVVVSAIVRMLRPHQMPPSPGRPSSDSGEHPR